MKESKVLTQSEVIAKKLNEISKDIMASEKKEYLCNPNINTHNISASRLSRYLNGRVANTEIGLSLYNFFYPKVDFRNKSLQQLS